MSGPLEIRPVAGSRPARGRELHVRRSAREKYAIHDSLYALSGNVILADLQATRTLARRIKIGRATV